MSKKKDLVSLGEAYGNMLNKVVIKEEKLPVPAGVVGEAPLEAGGPEEKSGFRPSKIDITKMSDKDKEDNIYNIKGYTYGDGNNPGFGTNQPDPTGPEFDQVPYSGIIGPDEDEEDKEEVEDKDDKKKKKKKKNEEDEEILAEHEKIARAGLNNFMSKTSVFDKLYNKVMVSENFGEEVDDVTELEALGIETDEVVDEVPEEITVIIPGELAQTLSEILTTALAQQETEVDINVDVEEVTDTEFEEDEEAQMKDGGGYGIDAGSTLSKEINMGTKNKVGRLRPATGLAQKDGGGYGIDAGSTLSKEINMGTKNKVGRLRPATGLAQKDGGGYGIDAGSTLSKEINMGTKNKVGRLRPATGLAQKDGGGYGIDAGSTLSKEINMGKQNKVGNIKLGNIPGA
tara:strand:- start:1336 stop:2535 length:1200 start_codon:yes stop_codon:yes gene_type:complete